MSKYKVIENGKSYMCTVCKTVYTGPNSRNMAVRCYNDHQAVEALRNYIPYRPEPKKPGDGIERPDVYDHFRRINRANPDYLRVVMGKARYILDKRESRENIEAWLNAAIRRLESWEGCRSPLQRLSYAYKRRNWEAVKQAAIAFGYTVAVEMKLDTLNIPDIIRNELDLNRAIVEYLENNSSVNREFDLQAFRDKLEVDILLDDILRGDSENDNGEGPTSGDTES